MRTCSGACTSGKSRSRSSLAGCGQLPITFAYASIERAQPFESSSSLHVRAAPIGSSHARAAGGVSLLRTLDEPQAEQASYEKAHQQRRRSSPSCVTMTGHLLAATLLIFTVVGVSGCAVQSVWECTVQRYGNKVVVNECHPRGY